MNRFFKICLTKASCAMLALAVTAVSLPMTVSAAEKEIIVNRSVAINRIDDCKEGERANYWVDENFAITPAVFEYMKENQTANLRLEGAYFDFIFDSQKLDNLASTEYWVRNERKAQHDQSIRRKVRSEALQTFYFKINQAFPDGTTMRYQSMFSPGSTVDVYKYDEQTETGTLIATCKVAMGSLMTLPMLETGDYYVLLHDTEIPVAASPGATVQTGSSIAPSQSTGQEENPSTGWR